MVTDKSTSPIGVFDSGVGGISVLKVLAETMPQENFIYFGDSANAPYGEKSRDEVRECAHNVVRKLRGMGAKAVVIACNTATSAAAKFLRDAYPDFPIIGMEPAVKPAAAVSEHPTVLVMATPLTIREEKFRSLIARYADSADFIDVPCHGLVELVECGITEGYEMDALLHNILDCKIEGKKIDSAVLGCTHYIHAKASISSLLGADVKIFDGADGTARETLRRLSVMNLLNTTGTRGSIEIYNSSGDCSLIEISRKLFG